MGNLLIKDEILEKVEAFAKVRGIPVQQQAEELLKESLARRLSQDQLRKLLEAVASLTSADVPQTDSVTLIRESRNR